MKFKIRKAIYNIITNKSIEILYAVLIIFFFYIIDIYFLKKQFSLNNYFELKLATSLSATYFIAVLFKWFSKQIEKKIEDGLKLTNDYKAVIKQYSGDLNKMLFIKSNELPDKIDFGKSDLSFDDYDELEIFPIKVEYFNDTQFSFSIKDYPEKKYELPDIINNHFVNLFNAHKHSVVYNAVNVRLDDLKVNNNNVELLTSRTSYFNGLVTNRVMDHIFSPHLSVRKLFEYGNQISSLKDSMMSNHLGINGSILTNDNKIVFVHRFKNVSIGKNIIGCSVGASLKTKYCLDAYGKFTLMGLEKAIKAEIYDELGIKNENYTFSLEKTVVGVYRDLVEGGKPQILFAVRVNLSSKEVETQYKIKCKNKKNKRNLVIDGDKLLFIELDDIRVTKTTVFDNANRKKYETIPSVAASVGLTIRWFNEQGIK